MSKTLNVKSAAAVAGAAPCTAIPREHLLAMLKDAAWYSGGRREYGDHQGYSYDVNEETSLRDVLYRDEPSNALKKSSTIFDRINIGRKWCRCLKITNPTRMNTMRNRVKPPTKHQESSSGRGRNCSKSQTQKTHLVK